MGGLIGLYALAAVGAAMTGPTPGESWRLIYTDARAFDLADQNDDGRISDYEFEVFHDGRGGYDRTLSSRLNTPANDTNDDGAFTPNELYAEARSFDRESDDDRRRGVDYGNPYDDE